MINLKKATELAKSFLQDNGVLFTSLEEVYQEENKWVVSFRPSFFVSPIYVVEIEKETGEIIGYHQKNT